MTYRKLHQGILREYDVRGVAGETLTSDDARLLGKAYGTTLVRQGGRIVAVGWDGRVSTPALTEALVDGLATTGIEVLRIGLGPTPMLYFADKYLATDGAIMVTGSHNPPDQNGFKMVVGGKAIYGDAIQSLGALAEAGDFATGHGRVAERPVLDAYIERLLQDAAIERPLSVVWDAGNGAAGVVLPRLCPRLPGRHAILNEAVDGTFPAHHPDPTLPETLQQLRAAVEANDCDVGIAFDGDADRIGVIDGEGAILWGDQIMVLLAEEVLQEHPGATIIADVKASQVLFDAIARMGGRPLMWRTGHSLIKAKMAETGAPLAGEMSGHIFLADRYYGYDDAIYVAIRLLNLVARSGCSLATLRRRLPAMVNTPELRIPCADDRKFAIVAAIRECLNASGAELNDLDGVRVRTSDGWWLLRASNTQDVLVARCEAATPAGLERLKSELATQLIHSGFPRTTIGALLGSPAPRIPAETSQTQAGTRARLVARSR